MSLAPDYNRPDLNNVKWVDIEHWRNDLHPSVIAAVQWAGGDVGHWRLGDVQYDADTNVTQARWISPTNDQCKVDATYAGDEIQSLQFSYLRSPYLGDFLPTTPSTVTLTWLANVLQTTVWS